MLSSFFNDHTDLPTVSIDETIPSPNMFQQLDSIITDKETFQQFCSYVHKQA